MKKWLLWLLPLLALLLFWLPISSEAETLPAAPTHFYYDQLNILSNQTKDLVENKGLVYKEKRNNHR